MSEDDVLSVFEISPRQPHLFNEYHFFNETVKVLNPHTEFKMSRQYQRPLAKSTKSLGKHRARQFGTDKCESLSKLANIIGHQFMSLHEKQKRMESKNSMKYSKPCEPPALKKAIGFRFQKGAKVMKDQGYYISEKGKACFMAVTRQKRDKVLGQVPAPKYTMDSGIGHKIDDEYLDNRKKINSRDHAIVNYISRVGRDDHIETKQFNRVKAENEE